MKNVDPFVQSLLVVADDKKADNSCLYKLKDPFIADYVLIVGAKNTVHCKSIAADFDKAISDRLPIATEDEGLDHPKITGSSDSGWQVIDAGAIVIHVMTETVRAHYAIDSLFEVRSDKKS